jgi:hypothetical protein
MFGTYKSTCANSSGLVLKCRLLTEGKFRFKFYRLCCCTLWINIVLYVPKLFYYRDDESLLMQVSYHCR